MTGKITRLYPLPAREIAAGTLYEDLELPPPERRDPSRPYVVINMVSSIDGKTAIGGKSSRLGSETDRQTMRTLRSKADAVMIGASTLRAERLSLGLDDPSFGPQPLAIIVSKTGNVPIEDNLIVAERQEVLLLSPEDLPERLDERALRVPRDPSGNIDFGEALKTLKSERAIDLLLVEGGPTLNHSLISHNLADELFLTLAPKLLGGNVPETLTILHGHPLSPEAPPPKLLSALLASDELFLRYDLHPLQPYNTNPRSREGH